MMVPVRRRRSSVLPVLLTLALLVTSWAGWAPAASAKSPAATALCGAFSDLSAADPACGAVLKLAAKGVLNGYPDGTFRPQSPVTRAEFAKMAVLAFDRTPSPAGSLPFSDVAGHWAAVQGYLQAAVAMHAVDGFPDGTFRPDSSVTRAQAVKVAGATLNLYPSGPAPYADVHATDWYSGWVAVASRADLIGHAAFPVWTEATFDADRPATRAEVAMLLGNLPMMPTEAQQAIATGSAQAIAALKNQDMTALAAMAHPTKGIRFSPYASVRMGAGGDLLFSPSALAGALSDTALYDWGVWDGSGAPIHQTFAQYYAGFIYDEDFASAPEVSYNLIWQRGNTVNNLLEAYPASAWVEYHFPGFDPQYGGMDWRSLRLVFENESGTWYLVGIIHDQWTI